MPGLVCISRFVLPTLRNYLKTICVGRELPFDKLRANGFFSEPVFGKLSSERILR